MLSMGVRYAGDGPQALAHQSGLRSRRTADAWPWVSSRPVGRRAAAPQRRGPSGPNDRLSGEAMADSNTRR